MRGNSKNNIKPNRVLCLDSQASHSITSCIDLFGANTLKDNINFNITDWANESRTISRHGDTIFGSMIYAGEVDGTILSMNDVFANWNVTWSKNKFECSIQHKVYKDITILFRNEGSNVLNAQVSDDIWDRLCSPSSGVKINYTLSTKDIKHISEGVRFHETCCHAGTDKMIQCIRNNVLHDCPISISDIENLALVNEFGCNACKIGKIKKESTDPRIGKHVAVKGELPALSEVDIDEVKQETLGMDIMFIMKRPYLITVGKFTGYIHVVPIENKSKAGVRVALTNIIHDYKRNQKKVLNAYITHYGDNDKHDFVVKEPINRTESDNEGAFLALAVEELPAMGISSTFVAADEHIGYVERQILTIKQRFDSTAVSLPFKVEGKLADWLVVNVTNWMNIMPCTKGTKGAWYNMTSRKLSYKALTMTKFGQPVVAHKTHGHLGDGKASGEIGISLGCVMDYSGSIYFYSLMSNQVKLRRRYAAAGPIDVIDYGLLKNNEYIGSGERVIDYNKNMNQRPCIVEPNDDVTDDLAVMLPDAGSFLEPRPTMEQEDVPPIVNDIPINNNLFAVKGDNRYINPIINDESNRIRTYRERQELAAMEQRDRENNNTGMTIDLDQDVVNNDDDEVLAGTAPVRRVQPSRNAKDNHGVVSVNRKMVLRKARRDNKVFVRKYMCTLDVVINKFKTISWKKGLQAFGDDADMAITAELSQIAVEYDLCHPTMVKPTEYHRSHDLFDQKADGRFKARLVVGKTAHGGEVDYGVDLYSPTIDMKVVKLMLSIGLESNLSFSVLDVKGAFLKSPMLTKGVYVRLEPHVVARLVKIKHEWKEFVRSDGSMMVECDKAWYGLSASSALWNTEIHNTLTKECGYTRHSTVACCYYKQVDKVKTFIMLHVDDMGVLMPPDNVEYNRVLSILENKYEALRIQYGDKVNYIGLEIERDRKNNCFLVGMSDRIAQAAKDFGVSIGKKVSNPAMNRLFSKTVLDETEKTGVTGYRSLVMTMAYISIVHPEMKYHASFLAGKQASPTVADLAKATHLMKYLISVKDERIVVSPIGKNPVVNVYCDAAFDVYSGSESHSGIAVFVGGTGSAVYCSSNKQHCITRSSTDAEVVSAETGVFIGCYFRDILEEIGIVANVVHHEDNNSCISLVSTGTQGYDRKERHMVRRINYMHRYFDDRCHRSSMEWCPTEDMVADILTKDLHGEIFETHKNRLKGLVK